MSVFSDSSYAPPGVYTQEVFNANTAILSTTARVPVFIGEGTEFFTISNQEMHRGSSATSDDQIVGENLSAQVNGNTRVFQLQHYPVVTGDGTGTVTNDTTKVSITVDSVPATLVSLVGSQGLVTLQDIVPEGSNITAQYYFKRTDTLISNEDISFQIPSFSTTEVIDSILSNEPALIVSTSIPGSQGNEITFNLTEGSPTPDISAVTGEGTNAITINLTKTDSTIRTIADVVNLISAGISTPNSGNLTVTVIGNVQETNAPVAGSYPLSGGAGPSTNTTFKVAHTPIVDGSNGGVTTTDPTKLTFIVNGVPVPLSSVDGATGLFTSSIPVAAGSSAQITYYTNTWQNTSDILPSENVASIQSVGYGPNTSSFIQGTDYVLNGNSVSWGAAVSTVSGTATAGYTPFDGSVINTTLVDERVYLRPVTGAVNGINTIFTLADSPVDGSGLGRTTDVPALVSVYIGADPVSAFISGPVRVLQLSGDAAQVTLYNPPTTGNKVYASYYRSLLADHTLTLTVAEPGAPGTGTYTIKDELNRIAPVTAVGAESVSNSGFSNEGIVWPNNFPDLEAPFGAANETVTLTFADDGLTTAGTSATPATLVVPGSGITLSTTSTGVATNGVNFTVVGGGSGVADSAALTATGDSISVNIVAADSSTRSWAAIQALFNNYPVETTHGGLIVASGTASSNQATAHGTESFSGGVNAVAGTPYANRFIVTTSRTAQQAQADGLGLTGGATTGTAGVGASGYLGQTYIDARTGVRFTIVDPSKALSYGYTQLPTGYVYTPGDTLTFTVSTTTGFVTGATPTLVIPGVQTQVVTTANMNAGDTAVVSTFNRAGNSPAVGDYYYVTYTTNKASTDFALQTFTNVGDAYTAYGQPSTQNRLSLALQFFKANGGGQFACIQVPKQSGQGLASDQSFIDAIQQVAVALPGSQAYANVIVPLSTSATVQQALGQFLTTQAAPRKKAEAIGFFGMGQYTTPAVAQATAQAIVNSRMIGVAPFLAGVMLQPNSTSTAVEYAVSGEFMAAALAGLALNPANDVATTLTGQNIVGFTRLLTTYDAPTMDAMAAAGLTVLVDNVGSLQVRHYKTTNPANALTSEPYVQTTADAIAQDFRQIFKQFIGIKEATGVVASIGAVGNAYLKGKMNSWITAYQPLVVTPDPTDPTTINVSVSYVPMFSLLYLNITFTVNIS